MSSSIKEILVQAGITFVEGETYLGGRIKPNGETEHSVIIAVNDERLSRDDQRKWAESVGGVLMNRIEALVIYSEHRSIVKEAAYWTDEDVDWDSSYAWCQGFHDGGQDGSRKSAALRAVAVRRFIQ